MALGAGCHINIKIKMGEIKKTQSVNDAVLVQIKQLEGSGGLQLPKDYIPANALKFAGFALCEPGKDGKSIMEKCTLESVHSSLLKMVIQGLDMSKDQCYLIPYGKTCKFERSYFGDIAVAKRVSNVVDVNSQVVYKGDDFKYKIDPMTSVMSITKHEQTFENLNAEIIGAYATVMLNDGSVEAFIMTMKDIKAAWSQRPGDDLSPAHKKFPAQMAKKTVIKRACGKFIKTSSDAVLYEESETLDRSKEELKATIQDEQAIEEISFEDIKDVDEELIKPEIKANKEAIDESIEKEQAVNSSNTEGGDPF
jgi:recombination protein RecT